MLFKVSVSTIPVQFSIFMEKVSQLCKLSGWVGECSGNVWLTNTYSISTRKFILEQTKTLEIIVPSSNVFQKLTVDTIVYTYQKEKFPGETFSIKSISHGDIADLSVYDTKQYVDGQCPISTVLNKPASELIFRIKELYPELQTFTKITRGVHPYRNGGYGLTAFGKGSQTERDVKERPITVTSRRRDSVRLFMDVIFVD